MILRRGTISKDVIAWQKFLSLPADGIFGAETENKTKVWQKANGLETDGEVGPNTLRKAGLASTVNGGDSGYFPPKPNFSSPSSSVREKMFGKFKYRRKNSTDIQILGNWTAENIVKVKIPQLIGVEGAPKSGEIYFHKAGTEQIKGFFAEVERQGLLPLVISWAGSFYPRFVRGSKSSLSNHSWGTAFDINAPQNWLGSRPAAVGQNGSLLKLVPIANSFGFFWGGHYRSRLDGMHFELAVLDIFPTPAEETIAEEEIGEDLPITVPDPELISETPPVSPAEPEMIGAEPEMIGIEKPEPRGFIKTIRGEITALVVGNGGFQAVMDKTEQVKAFGLSSSFWKTLAAIALIGSMIYLLYRYLDYRQDGQRDLEITNKLIDVNSRPNSNVVLVGSDYQPPEAGFESVGSKSEIKIIRR